MYFHTLTYFMKLNLMHTSLLFEGMYRKIILLCLPAVSSCIYCCAQPGQDDSAFAARSANAAASLYENAAKGGSVLFSGNQYMSYSHGIKGTPFLAQENLTKGSVSYNGVVFDDILINYDVVKDELISMDYSGNYIMQFIKTKAASFTINNRCFVRIDNPGSSIEENGFFEKVINGNASFFVKRKKTIRQAIGAEDTSSFEIRDSYYIFYNQRFFQVTNTKSLYAVTGNNRGIVRNFLSSRRDDFKKDPESTIAAFCNYLNTGKN